MAGVTPKNISYPTSGDSIAPLETHFQNLAESADNVGVISGVQTFNGPAATGGTVDVVVTFAQAFPIAPQITATVEGHATSSVYASTVLGTPSTTGFTIRVFRCNGTAVENGLKVMWLASTYIAP
jgi:predicted phage tail protein